MRTRWTFKTKRFTVEAAIERDRRYRYDGEDADGSIQAARNADAMRVCERTENTETCYNIINN